MTARAQKRKKERRRLARAARRAWYRPPWEERGARFDYPSLLLQPPTFELLYPPPSPEARAATIAAMLSLTLDDLARADAHIRAWRWRPRQPPFELLPSSEHEKFKP